MTTQRCENSSCDKILSYEQAEIYRNHGWKAADLHVHTLCSPDVISAKSLHPEALYHRAREMGMDFVTFTDHETMRAYDLLNGGLEGLVTGVEMRIKDMDLVGHTLHINVYDLKQGTVPGSEGDLRTGRLKPFHKLSYKKQSAIYL